MKLFYFNPNNYGETAVVMAENKEAAIEKLKASKPDGDSDWDKKYHAEKIDQMVNCKNGYTIDEIPSGVHLSELA